ncbi:MAG: DUF89 family protein [Kiritimatiellaeota bacterium]|nr:DUF89 family protein [Kiritimatiellota bacterium]
MRIYYECLPCFVNQTLKAVKTLDEGLRENVLRDSIRALSEIDFSMSPPEMARVIFDMIECHTGPVDHYENIKRKSNEYVMGMLDDLRATIASSADRFESALRLAIAGNIIDFGAKYDFTDDLIHGEVEEAENAPIKPDEIAGLKSEIAKAERILYLGDNAGEIVFDKLFIEELPREKITFAVRGSAIINDALMEDAENVGLTDLLPVISNGAAVPGTILHLCSEKFQQVFAEADLVISKGQGNFETLSDVDKNIYFLLKVKCDVVAKHLNCSLGDFVVRKSGRGAICPPVTLKH